MWLSGQTATTGGGEAVGMLDWAWKVVLGLAVFVALGELFTVGVPPDYDGLKKGLVGRVLPLGFTGLMTLAMWLASSRVIPQWYFGLLGGVMLGVAVLLVVLWVAEGKGKMLGVIGGLKHGYVPQFAIRLVVVVNVLFAWVGLVSELEKAKVGPVELGLGRWIGIFMVYVALFRCSLWILKRRGDRLRRLERSGRLGGSRRCV